MYCPLHNKTIISTCIYLYVCYLTNFSITVQNISDPTRKTNLHQEVKRALVRTV